MNKVAEHLAEAVSSLTKADKAEVIQHILEDPEIKDIIARMLVDRLGESGRGDNFGGGLAFAVTSNKERGRQVRDRYITHLEQAGIRIEQVKGMWAKTGGDLWAAMPFANEQRPNRWFLGLREADVAQRTSKGGVVVVLLCQSNTEGVQDFVLPQGKVEEIVPHLSRSQGQLKFNLKRVGSRYHLVIPGRPAVDVSDYSGAVSVLRS